MLYNYRCVFYQVKINSHQYIKKGDRSNEKKIF